MGELDTWRKAASVIPDEPIRADALQVLDGKRTHLYGAALFWTLPPRRSLDLLRLLVAHEMIWDFLDNLSERAVAHGQTDGRYLHLAISDALDPAAPISDYYHLCPWHNDGGYLSVLVRRCQSCCAALPSYSSVQELTLREARRAQVLALNHYPEPAVRDTMLKRWAAREYPDQPNQCWWELSGAASAPLAIHALLALAAEPNRTKQEATQTYTAYAPLAAATTMLDSYVDQHQDLENGDHSYVGHYPDEDSAVAGIRALTYRSLSGLSALPHGQKHAVIASAMIAMYLSKKNTPASTNDTMTLVRASGSLTRLMLPILRSWRLLNAQRYA